MKKIKIVSLISFLLVLGVNLYFRSFNLFFPQFKTKAIAIVEDSIVRETMEKINKEFPDYSSIAKDKLLKATLSEYKKQNKLAIKKRIGEEFAKLKDNYQDENGQTYLMELDCWAWTRYTQNILNHGHPGDAIVNGNPWDSLSLAPTGYPVVWNQFLYYFSAGLYKIFCWFKPVNLYTFVFYLPIFFIILLVLVLYLFCRACFGEICAVVSCLFVGLSPLFLSRSSAGWFDTDILHQLFSLLIVLSYLKSYSTPSLFSRLLWICFSAFWVGLFAYSWLGWWFIFLVVIIYEAYSQINLVLQKLQYKLKIFDLWLSHTLHAFLFIFFSCLWIIFICGWQPLKSIVDLVKQALSLNTPIIAGIWPNVNATISELSSPRDNKLFDAVGGVFLLIAGVLSMLVLFLRASREREKFSFARELIIMLIFWHMAMFYACTKGIRFAVFLLIPLGISLGWMLNEIYDFASTKAKMGKWIRLAVLAFIVIFAVNQIRKAQYNQNAALPLMNDNYYQALKKIKAGTPEDAIINSWWDYGDWYKAVAKRRVIFDGQTQHIPQAYWMAKVFLTDSEKKAIAILRMLDNGANQAFELINREISDPFQAVKLLEKALETDKKSAKELLRKSLTQETVEKLTKLLYAKPPKAYFIVDNSLPNKISTISFLGNWDFAKVYVVQNLFGQDEETTINYLGEKFGMEKNKARALCAEAKLLTLEENNSWISYPLNYYVQAKGNETHGLVLFLNGGVYNPEEKFIYLYSFFEQKYKTPKNLFIESRNNLTQYAFNDSELSSGVLVYNYTPSNASNSSKEIRALELSPELAASMMTRLFYLKGAGLKYFKPLEQPEDEANAMRIFEIIWE